MTRPAGKPNEGDASIEVLATRFRAPLIRYFLRRGIGADQAEDMTHDVFVRLSRAGLASVNDPEAYLFATASSVIIDRARRARVRCEDQHDPINNIEIASREPSPACVFEGREALLRLAAILDELPERTREIFLLSRMDGLTNTQLAARYGITVKSIEKHMTRALAHLRNRFDRNG